MNTDKYKNIRSYQPLNQTQLELLNKLVYQQHFIAGRTRFFAYLQANYPEYKIARLQLQNWLKNQEFYQLHLRKPTHKSTKPIQTSVSKPKKILQIDLIDMQTYKNSNNNYGFLLMMIDIFSRKLFAYPILTKTSANVAIHLLPLVKQYNYKAISSDNGNEFNITLPEGVNWIRGKSYTPQSQAIVERTNGTIKQALFKIFTIQNSQRWINILPQVIDNYNNTIHTGINKTPNQSFNSSEQEQQEQFKQVSEHLNKSIPFNTENVLTVGSLVRIAIRKESKSKGEPTFTNEIYKIASVIKSKNAGTRVKYILTTQDNTKLPGTYNITDIQPIEKVILPPVQTRVNKEAPKRIRRIDQREINELNRDIIQKPLNETRRTRAKLELINKRKAE
jgi:hypothetical protein